VTSPFDEWMAEGARDYARRAHIQTEALAGRLDIASLWILTELDRSEQEGPGVMTLTGLAERLRLPLDLIREAMIRLADRGAIEDASPEAEPVRPGGQPDPCRCAEGIVPAEGCPWDVTDVLDDDGLSE
jgi:hypothetical protein